MAPNAETKVDIDLELLRREFPPPEDGSAYLNSGSCGRKPQRALKAWSEGIARMNSNPTLYTFFDTPAWDAAKQAACELFDVPTHNLLLTNSTGQGLQLIMESFLLDPGDELVTTTHEHVITKTIWQYLKESRGIVVRQLNLEPVEGSEALCKGLLSLVTKRTKLVEVSEVDCYTGWKPDLTLLTSELESAGIPLLVDGAHSPGQIVCRPASYPLWVGSGHKWLGGPNGTGFAYVRSDLIAALKPVWLGERFYNLPKDDLTRFEWQGTADIARWPGLAEACRLTIELGTEHIAARQRQLVSYLRSRLKDLPEHQVRTAADEANSTGLFTVTWASDLVPVEDLRDALWEGYRVWTQPAYFYPNPGHGIRISCHPANTERELDRLIEALKKILK